MGTSEVSLSVHFEPDGDADPWWASSVDVDGFFISAATLTELQVVARMSLADILSDQGKVLGRVVCDLVVSEAENDNPSRITREDAVVSYSSASHSAAVSAPKEHVTGQ